MTRKKYILLFISLLGLLILLSSCGTSMGEAEASEDHTNEKTEDIGKEKLARNHQTNKNAFENPKVIKHLKIAESVPEKKEPLTEQDGSKDKDSTATKTTTVASNTTTENSNAIKSSTKKTSTESSASDKSNDNKSKTKPVEQEKQKQQVELKKEPKKEKPKNAEPKKEQEKKVVLDVPYVNQYSPTYAPFGCEGASLLMALKYKTGTAVGLKQFLDDMPKDPRNPYKGFASSPFKVVKGVFQSIFPAPLTAYGKKYSGGVANISGSSVATLKAELDKGNPTVVFVTLDFAYPTWSKWDMGYEAKKSMVDNMHVVVLTGYNSNGSYHVADPAGRGKYWVSKSKFENAYNALQWAVVVR